jgi:hypothetical protein
VSGSSVSRHLSMHGGRRDVRHELRQGGVAGYHVMPFGNRRYSPPRPQGAARRASASVPRQLSRRSHNMKSGGGSYRTNRIRSGGSCYLRPGISGPTESAFNPQAGRIRSGDDPRPMNEICQRGRQPLELKTPRLRNRLQGLSAGASRAPVGARARGDYANQPWLYYG